MIVALSKEPLETALSGHPDEYLELARMLEAGTGTVGLDTGADPAPYGSVLAAIVVRERDSAAVTISVDDDRLIVEGPVHLLSVLAGNVRGSATSGDPEGHAHIEYFPGHYYLGENSVPLVIHDAMER
ncbi:MAG TPA: hypothetical protein VJT49_06695 [Amycolatopsis sp.]|uniref:Imm32 family immunity protein n=1 Tax=Amycolatopsis sp. TaxID=37632 RepID=UPI002B4A0985|nr:hypothetical protein [Amycolatopsis sp.]HKS44795.1 hypothetical protein [Amycolatopsis sp.]